MKLLLKGLITKSLLKSFLILFLGFTSILSIKAQPVSEVWAGGQITVDLISGICGGTGVDGTPTYRVTLKFYRDAIGTADPLPNTKTVLMFSKDENILWNRGNGAEIPITLTLDDLKTVEQYCLNGNPVATEGAWYSGTVQIPVQSTWYFGYIGAIDGDYRSPEDRNILLGQKFYIETFIDNTCGDVSGTKYNPATNTYDPVVGINPLPLLYTHEFIEEDPVASFCVDSSYNYELKPVFPIYDDIFPISVGGQNRSASEYGDSVSFHARAVKIDFGNSEAIYEFPYGGFNSFPSKTPISYDDRFGKVELTPSKEFAGPVLFEVRRYMNYYYTDPITVDPQQVLKIRKKVISRSLREYRFIFDRNCNPRIPDFVGGKLNIIKSLNDTTFVSTYNPLEDAYEYDCRTKEFVFELSEPMLCNSIRKPGIPLEEQDQGFRMATEALSGGVPLAFLDDVPIEKVVPMNCDDRGEFTWMKVILGRNSKGNQVYLGPGRYILYMKKGDDGNTMINRCESTIPEEQSLATILVNDNLTYIHDDEANELSPPGTLKKSIRYCYPNNPPKESINNRFKPAAYLTWKLIREDPNFNNPNNDTSFHDTTLYGPETFVLDKPFNKEWEDKVGVGAGWWIVGVGYDYSTIDPATGDTILKRVCYDEDRFFVDTVSSKPIDIPDFDLCVKDPWPIINLDSLKGLVFPESFEWYKLVKNSATDIGVNPERTPVLISTDSFMLRTDNISQTGDTNVFEVAFVFIETGCRVFQKFYVLKDLLEANIGNDSVICQGEQYVLRNKESDSYFIESNYSYQWYLNDVVQINDTTDTMMVTITGEYKLEVTKTTPFSNCTVSDSVVVRVADTADKPIAYCLEITFEDGDVKQLFGWNPVANAYRYEVRPTDPFETVYQWDTANTPGLKHRTIGRQIGLQVRGLNTAVDPTARCYYGPVSDVAIPCDALVKTTNVFTPNGDGINDFLAFDLVEVYPGSKLQVFNRWGRLVYENDDYYNDWDGDDLPAGTYFFILDVKSEVQDIIKGTFTIFRE